jgi:YVTN family beta-propeller protein
MLGSGTRIGSTPNWQRTGLALTGTGLLRARGRTTNGNQNGSSGLVEHVLSFDFPATVPNAPTIGTARAGNGEVQVYFTPPANNGGSSILSYTASCGAVTALGTASPVVVTGLVNGTSVTCTVRATNSVGTGPASLASNSVTPSATITAVGPFAYVPRHNTGQMAVLDLGSNSVITSISGGAGIGIAVAPNGLRAYVIDQGLSAVKVINTVTKTLLTSIAVGAGPWSAVVSPDSTRLYVSNRTADTVSVIDTASNSVLSTFNVAAAPTGLVISPDGSKLYVGSATTFNLTVVALPSNVVSQFPVGANSHALAISPDGSRVYFVDGQGSGRMRAFNTATNTLAGSVNVGGVPTGINISADGSRVYVSNNGGIGNFNGNTVSQIDAATMTVIATGATGPGPLGVDVHPDGSRVYVGNNNGTMSVLDTAGMTSVVTIDMGSAHPIFAMGNFIARTSTPSLGRRLSVGSITLPATIAGANSATRVLFAQPFSATPIVIAQPDDTDSDPKAVRIANINASGFDVLQIEPRGCVGCTGAGGAMNVHWLAALPGVYRLPNDVPNLRGQATPTRVPGAGILVKVGSVLTMASQRSSLFGGFAGFAAPSWQVVSFPSAPGDDFSAPPILLTSLQSWNPSNAGGNFTLAPLPARPSLNGVSRLWLSTAVRNVSASGFDTALESGSSDNTGAVTPGLFQPESVGYIAIESAVSTQLAVMGGTLVPLATATGSSDGNPACAPVNMAFPDGAVINTANLRGFAGLHTRNEEDGGWLRRCAFATPGGSALSIGTRVDEDADLSSDRSHPTSETVGTAVFGGDFSTTPVSLVFVTASRSGTQLNVQFGSATEAGHLGYRIWGRADVSQDWRALHEDLIVNRTGDAMSAKSYQRTVEAAGISEIRLEDVDLTGVSRFHPEIKLDANGATSVGAPALDQPLNWAAIRASNAATPVRSSRGTGAASVLASVRKTGIQRASFADLLAAGFSADVPVSALAVLENGLPVARHIECNSGQFGPGCFVEWLAQTRPSLYGNERLYQISNSPAAVRAVGGGAIAQLGTATRAVPAEIQQFPNRDYSFSAPGNDPWFDQRLVASSTPVEVSRTFSLPARVAGSVQLSVDLWGGLDFSGAQNSAPDHSVELLLNGTSIARERFDGLVLKRISQSVNEALLLPLNTLTLRLPADTGYSADVVLLDGFKVSYSRSSTLSEGELSFGEFSASGASDVQFADGMESRNGFAVNGVSGQTTVWSQMGGRILRDQASANTLLDTRVSAVHISASAQLQAPALSSAAAPQTDFANADYLIVTHPLFEAELAPLISLQQSRGYSVKTMRTDAIYAAKSAHQRSPQAIREAIAQVNPRFVLLIGGDSYDYDDNLNVGSQSYLPTFYRVSDPIVRFAATDAPFVDSNDDGKPERALGRIPARTVEELRRAIDSIVRRGNTPVGSYFASAGGSNASEHFATHSRALLSYLRQGQSTSFALADEVGVSEARSKATAALTGGSDWINYLGHSSPNRWAAQNLLDTTQLGNVQRVGLPAIVAQWGCWNSYFVIPTQDTMSHALMLRSNTLAAAVIGSTSLAEDASHLALGTRFFYLIEDGRIDDRGGVAINTLGEALQAAKADLAVSAPEHLESNYSITLFGDPAMRVR